MLNRESNMEELFQEYERLQQKATENPNLKTMLTIYKNQDSDEITVDLYNCLPVEDGIASQEEKLFSTRNKEHFMEEMLPALLKRFAENNLIESQDIKETPWYDGLNLAIVGSECNMQLENFDRDILEKTMDLLKQVKKEDTVKDDPFSLALQYARLSTVEYKSDEERAIFDQANKIIQTTNGSYNKLNTERKLAYLEKQLEVEPDNKSIQRMIESLTTDGKKDATVSRAFRLANFKFKHQTFLSDKNNSLIIAVAQDAARDGYFSMPTAMPEAIIAYDKAKVLEKESANRVNFWTRKVAEYESRPWEEAETKNEVLKIARLFQDTAAKVDTFKDGEYYESLKSIIPIEDLTDYLTEREKSMFTDYPQDEKTSDLSGDAYVAALYGVDRDSWLDTYKNSVEFEEMTEEDKRATLKHAESLYKEAMKKRNDLEKESSAAFNAAIREAGREYLAKDQKEAVRTEMTEEEKGTIETQPEAVSKANVDPSFQPQTIEQAIEGRAVAKTDQQDEKLTAVPAGTDNEITVAYQNAVKALKRLGELREDLRGTTADQIIELNLMIEQAKSNSIPGAFEQRAQERQEGLPLTDHVNYENLTETAQSIVGSRETSAEQNRAPEVSTTVAPQSVEQSLEEKKADINRVVAAIQNDPRMAALKDKLNSLYIDRINIASLSKYATKEASEVNPNLMDEMKAEIVKAEQEFASGVLSLVRKEQAVAFTPKKELTLPQAVLDMRQNSSLRASQELFEQANAKRFITQVLLKNDLVNDKVAVESVKEDYDKEFLSSYQTVLNENRDYIETNPELSMDLASKRNLAKLLNAHFASKAGRIEISVIPGHGNNPLINIARTVNGVPLKESFTFTDSEGFDNDVMPAVAIKFAENCKINAAGHTPLTPSGNCDYIARSESQDQLILKNVDMPTITKIHGAIDDTIKKLQVSNPTQQQTAPVQPQATQPKDVTPPRANSQNVSNPNGHEMPKRPSRKVVKSEEPVRGKERIKKLLKNPIVQLALVGIVFPPALLVALPTIAAYHGIKYYKDMKENNPDKIVSVKKAITDIPRKLKKASKVILKGIGAITLAGAIGIGAATIGTVLGAPIGLGAAGAASLIWGVKFATRRHKNHKAKIAQQAILQKNELKEQARIAAEAEKRAAHEQRVAQYTTQEGPTVQQQAVPTNVQSSQPMQQQVNNSTQTQQFPVVDIQISEDVVLAENAKLYRNDRDFQTQENPIMSPVNAGLFIAGKNYDLNGEKVRITGVDSISPELRAKGARLESFALGYANDQGQMEFAGFANPKDVIPAKTSSMGNGKGKY